MGDSSTGAFGAPQAEPDAPFEDPMSEPSPDVGVSDDPAHPESDGSSDPSSGSPDAELAKPAEGGSTDGDVTQLDALSVDPPLSELTTALKSLEVQTLAFHTRAENYEQIIRQMQSRIEQLQGDQVQALLKPVIQRFAGLHAQAIESSEQARDRLEAAEKDFSFFAVAIEEALGLVDIESVGASPSVEFDPRKHHASRIVATGDPELDKRIQRVLRQGFTYAGAPRVFLPAQVSVYRYEPVQVPADVQDPDNDPANEPAEGEPGE